MQLKVKPTQEIKGQIYLPASKSYSIRAFLNAMCGGSSLLIRPSNCDDALVAKKIAGHFGSRIIESRKNVFKIKAFYKAKRLKNIDVRESGTVLRFLLPLLSLHAKQAKVTGIGTLKGRPNKHLNDSLRSIGVDIKGSGKNEGIPISLSGGGIKGGKIKINGSISSQFISALLITLPQLEEDSFLEITGDKVVSADYITMTINLLKKCGVRIDQRSARKFYVKGNQKFKGLKSFEVPSDYGLAAFLMGAACLIPSNIVMKGNLDSKLIQADGQILECLKKMGVKFKKNTQKIEIKGPFQLKGGQFSLKSAPDLVPIMAVLSLFAASKVRIYDIAHARVKESDRISDLRKELLKVGAKIKESKNEMLIFPQKEYKSDVLLDPHQDHRLAMAFAVLGLRIGCRIKNVECCSKSYPDFVNDLKKLKAKAFLSY